MNKLPLATRVLRFVDERTGEVLAARSVASESEESVKTVVRVQQGDEPYRDYRESGGFRDYKAERKTKGGSRWIFSGR